MDKAATLILRQVLLPTPPRASHDTSKQRFYTVEKKNCNTANDKPQKINLENNFYHRKSSEY